MSKQLITSLTYDKALEKMSVMTESELIEAMNELVDAVNELGPGASSYYRAIMTNESLWSEVLDKKYYSFLSAYNGKSDFGFKILSHNQGLCLKEIFFEDEFISKPQDEGIIKTISALRRNVSWVKELYKRGYDIQNPIKVMDHGNEKPLHQYISEGDAQVVFELIKEESSDGDLLNKKYPGLKLIPQCGSSTEDDILIQTIDIINDSDSTSRKHVESIMSLIAGFGSCTDYPWFEPLFDKASSFIKTFLNNVDDKDLSEVCSKLLTSKAISNMTASLIENFLHEKQKKIVNSEIFNELQSESDSHVGEKAPPYMVPY